MPTNHKQQQQQRQHIIIFTQRFRSGNYAAITAAVPEPGQPGKVRIRMSRKATKADVRDYRRLKKKVEAELSRFSGDRTSIVCENPPIIAHK